MATSNNALAPGLARKLKKILETRTEAPEVTASLTTLSQFYGDNTPAARHQLRSTIENEGVKINEQFLAALEGVMAALDLVQADLDSLSSCCEQMNATVASSRASGADLLAETERLRRALGASETRSALVGTFLEQYQLAPTEMEALQREEVGEAFFLALEHVRSIHANCKTLLRTNHQRAGLELMDAMASLQEGGYERLCRWVQAECRGLSDVDAPEVNPLLQRAAGALRDRQVLFRYCMEEVAAARHTALFQRFIKALTQGPRPIEMHAPDPRRYVSDMLAWMHTSLASEREFLVSLFGEDALPEQQAATAAEAAPAGGVEPPAGQEAPRLSELLDTVFESICRPLKVRIEQVLMSAPAPLLCFQLAQLLNFYLATVDKLLGSSSQLAEALRGCRAMALRTLHETVRGRGDKLARYPPPPPRGLTPPPALLEGAHAAAELVECYEQSFEAQRGAGAARDFDAVLAAVVGPLVEMCERSSEALNPGAASRVDDGAHLAPGDQRVYLLNCLVALRAPLEGHDAAVEQARKLSEALESHLSLLVTAEAGRALQQAGLAEVLQRVRLYRSGAAEGAAAAAGGTMAADAALSLARVSEAMRTFFGRLTAPDLLPEFPALTLPRLRADASQRVMQAVADAYGEVHDALLDPGSGYPAAEVAGAVGHTPAQVRTLLGVA